jgi:hypothetical protein
MLVIGLDGYCKEKSSIFFASWKDPLSTLWKLGGGGGAGKEAQNRDTKKTSQGLLQKSSLGNWFELELGSLDGLNMDWDWKSKTKDNFGSENNQLSSAI